MLSSVEKIKIIAGRRGLTNTDLAEAAGMTRQNLSNKFRRSDLRESDLVQLAQAMNCSLKISFVLNDTGEEI